MCLRCEATEAELNRYITNHKCGDGACPIPHLGPDDDATGTPFWLLAVVYARMSLVMDRMENAKGVVDNPDDLPSSILEDWEAHLFDAADMMRRVRTMRQSAERATKKMVEDLGASS
jgi:hypothetical protein